ncbi:hypothetical protein [Nostoc sp.]
MTNVDKQFNRDLARRRVAVEHVRVRDSCRRQPPLTPLNIHEKLCTL